MRSFFRGWCALALFPVCGLAAACSVTSTTTMEGVNGAPADAGASGGGTAAPTGQRWEGVQSDDGCGRTGISYVLVDEVCGREGKGYKNLDLHAPMFRDGAVVGDRLLAVDATFMWSLDLANPTGTIARSALLGGLGQPIAVARHGATVLVAAGEEGLVTVDATDAVNPRKESRLSLPGHALDVEVEGDTAYVALGREGIAVVDVSVSPPALVRTISVGGYAAGVKVKGRRAYVAACSSLAVVDLDSASVVGSTWAPDAVENGVLTAPAKDVEIVDDVAFVAAGKQGTIAVDVSDPARPQVLGNCSRPEPSFYGSGVRARDGKLFVAAGEWGVLPVDVTRPKSACLSRTQPKVPPTPPKDGPACTADPPWTVLPWESLWAPPPPAKDPIQVLPLDGKVLAFGDARRIGTRAVDVRDSTKVELPLVGRYDEPRALVGIAASGSRLVAAGARGGLFRVLEGGTIERVASDADPWLRTARAAAFLSDGRWVALLPTELVVEGRAQPIPFTNLRDAQSLVVVPGGTQVAAIGRTSAEILDVLTASSRPLSLPKSALPAAVTADGSSFFVAGPESVATRVTPLFGGPGTALAEHGVFTSEEVLDTGAWQVRLPRRKLALAGKSLVEVATLGDRAGLVVHAATPSRVTLPPATYDGIAVDGDKVFLTSLDRSLYRSTMVTVSIAGGRAELVSTEVFTGGASGVATAAGRAFVADADGHIRVYRTTERAPVLESTFSVEAP